MILSNEKRESIYLINVLKAYYQTSPLIIHGSYVCPIIKKKSQ